LKTKLEQIIAEADAFCEYDKYTEDAFVLIRDLAQEILRELTEKDSRPGKT
jgi:hypothetical protein